MDGIDLFKEYIIDRDGRLLHYDEKKRGFITYSYPPGERSECFIDDMFVLDDRRELKVVMSMIRFVEGDAKKRGVKFLTAAVNIRKPDAARILKAHLWHGMKPVATSADFIYTAKEL